MTNKLEELEKKMEEAKGDAEDAYRVVKVTEKARDSAYSDLMKNAENLYACDYDTGDNYHTKVLICHNAEDTYAKAVNTYEVARIVAGAVYKAYYKELNKNKNNEQ
jgi:hypothetical protein